jgi:hypothetical protein
LLNQTISEVTFDGKKRRTFVLGNNGTIARQVVDEDGTQKVSFEFTDASGMSLRNTNDTGSAELDPLGNNVGITFSYSSPPRGDSPPSPHDQAVASTESNCLRNGIYGPCRVVELLSQDGTFASRDSRLPFEMTGKTPYNPNHPLAINNEIRNQIFPDSYRIGGSDTRTFAVIYPDDLNDKSNDQMLLANYDTQYLSYLLGNPTQGQEDEKGMNECEKKLATQIFTNQKDMYFSDVLDGDSSDPRGYKNGSIPNPDNDTHNHLLNPLSDPFRETEVLAPAGGIQVWRGVVFGQNHIVLFYPELGGEKNVILNIVHVEKYAGKGKMADGRLRIGTMGKNGLLKGRVSDPLPERNKPKGWHIHINAYKWFNPKITGTGNIKRELRKWPFDDKSTRQNIPLSKLFCK